MPLTGDRKKDIPELMRKIRDRGTFGTAGHGKSKKKLKNICRKKK